MKDPVKVGLPAQTFQEKVSAGEVWYHFKYPQGCGDDRPYKIIGLAYDTTSEITYVVYQPLYKNDLMQEKSGNGVEYFVRPLSEWHDLKQTKSGELVPRFKKSV